MTVRRVFMCLLVSVAFGLAWPGRAVAAPIGLIDWVDCRGEGADAFDECLFGPDFAFVRITNFSESAFDFDPAGADFENVELRFPGLLETDDDAFAPFFVGTIAPDFGGSGVIEAPDLLDALRLTLLFTIEWEGTLDIQTLARTFDSPALLSATIDFTPVPEPGTLALLGMGMGAMGYRLRRRRS